MDRDIQRCQRKDSFCHSPLTTHCERIRFDLKHDSATFHRAKDVIIGTVNWQYALVYLDDHVVNSRTPSQHVEQAATVSRLMKSAGPILKWKKCFFRTDAMDYLRHKIRPGTRQVTTKTTVAIRFFKPRTFMSKKRFVLNLCSMERRYVPCSIRTAARSTRQ